MTPQFQGATFDQARDGARLGKQLIEVQRVMRTGEWHTLAEVAVLVGAPEASVSARFRQSRDEKCGGWQVERRYLRKGLFTYRFLPKPAPAEVQLKLACV